MAVLGYIAGAVCALVVFAIVVKEAVKVIFSKSRSPDSIAKNMLLNPLHFTGFETFINFPGCINHDISVKGHTLSVVYTIPRSICELEGDLHYISLGGILALADQLTTILVTAKDKTHRPGVSVSLSGSLVEDNKTYFTAGNKIELKAHIRKIGQTLGFTGMEVYSTGDNPKLLAVCEHIKYLKMGFIWDLIGDAIPALTAIYRLLYRIEKNKTPRESLSAALGISRGSLANEYSLQTHKDIDNPFRKLHGGAISCIYYHCSQQHIREMGLQSAFVKSLEIQYASPCHGSLTFSCQPKGADLLHWQVAGSNGKSKGAANVTIQLKK